jgi:hypothetical protein
MQAIAKSQFMKYRFISVFAALGLAAGSLALLAAPASAADGPPEVGCTTGSSCMVELNYEVTYTGSSGGHNGVVIKPPPCIGVPIGDAHTGSQAIISLYSNTAPVAQPSSASPAPSASDGSSSPTAPASPTVPASSTAPASPTASMSTASTTALVLSGQQQQILNQANQLVGSNPITPGEWYQISGNPYATATAQQRCTNLPPYIWVAGDNNTLRVNGLNIPPETLAALAFSQLSTAQLATVTLNPKGASDTNLPTFVDVGLRAPVRGVLSITADGDPYVWATAATPDGEAATVWAWVTGLSINPGTTNATTFNQQRCSTAHLSTNGHTLMLGSRYSAAEMAQVGAGQQIDCGVTYTAPGTYGLSASVTWNACWARGLAKAGGPPANCKPVPGAANLAASTSPPHQVAVREIQSVNNG